MTDSNNITEEKNEEEFAPEEQEKQISETSTEHPEKSPETSEFTETDDIDENAEEIIQADEQEDIETLQKELKETSDFLLRERAEFMNYRKRVIQEKADLESFVTGKILNEMMPVLDAFDQLFSAKEAADKKVSKFLDGVQLIRKQLWSAFEKFGVSEFNPEGESFDPNIMEALSVSESEKVRTETVENVFQKGYKIKDKIIRSARVSVVKPLASSGNEKE